MERIKSTVEWGIQKGTVLSIPQLHKQTFTSTCLLNNENTWKSSDIIVKTVARKNILRHDTVHAFKSNRKKRIERKRHEMDNVKSPREDTLLGEIQRKLGGIKRKGGWKFASVWKNMLLGFFTFCINEKVYTFWIKVRVPKNIFNRK